MIMMWDTHFSTHTWSFIGTVMTNWAWVLDKSLQSCPTLCDPADCSPPGFFDHGLLQARILEWIAMPSCRGSSWPRDWTCFSYVCCITGRFFTCWATGAFLAFLATGCSGQLFLPPDESPAKLDSKHLLGRSLLEILLRQNGQYGKESWVRWVKMCKECGGE